MTTSNPRFLNRELSWLEFNQRVLEEAQDPSVPLLERVKFLAITASNLDEFFRVRVGALQMMIAQSVTRPDPAGLTPQQQFDAVVERVRRMTTDQYACYLADLEPRLEEAGIRCIRPEELDAQQHRIAAQVFEDEIFSVLSPMAVSDADEFPLLPNQRLAVCVRLRSDDDDADNGDRFAIIPCGPIAPRFLSLPSENGYLYLLIEDVLRLFAGRYFTGQEILECVPFRITRNADYSLREDLASDLLAEMEQVLDERRTGDCIRLEIEDSASGAMLTFLHSALGIWEQQTYTLPGPLDLADLFQIAERRGFDNLLYESWTPQRSPAIPPGTSLFEVIAGGDLLLYHPYESFEPVVRLIEEAADDPDVLAIKQTLYRTSRNSPVVAALQRAAEKGKHVTVLVELKARFDEARNIEWARQLEQTGAQVFYGVKGLKTHAKVCIIVRREPQGIQRYVHFGTGNYNEATARIYSDASLMTADPDLGADAVAFFNAITGYSQPLGYRKLAAAPTELRDRLLEMIRSETDLAKDGQPARILAKVNALVDPRIIEALYEASQAGVEVRLNIRGVCCLRPGVPGLSENIEVVSIVDRFLEHARLVYFQHGGDERLFISSADWMPRNLDRRVELLVPVDDQHCQRRLIEILTTYFTDNAKAGRLLPDGQHERILPEAGQPVVRSQEVLFRQAIDAVREAEQRRRTVFEPHQAARP